MKAKDFFTEAEKARIVSAIQSAEKQTSGEIRVHVEQFCKENVLDRASWWFEKLGMQQTRLRNGVLIYFATKSKKIAIIGDQGINQKAEKNFWEEIKNRMIADFKAGNFVEGLEAGIESVGTLLKKNFPYQSDDENELEDEISFGD